MGMWLKDPDSIRAALKVAKTVAVVGLQDNPARPAFGVTKVLQAHGYKILPVHPAGGTVLGEPILRSVAELPQGVDLVDIFRNPANLPGLLDEILSLPPEKRPHTLWFQDGAMDPETAERAAQAGFTVIMTDCVARVLARMQQQGAT